MPTGRTPRPPNIQRIPLKTPEASQIREAFVGRKTVDKLKGTWPVLDEIGLERKRQIDPPNGFTREHDDKHDERELTRGAVCFAVYGCQGFDQKQVVGMWPFTTIFKPSTDYRSNLIKAAAMLVAEIERIDRL